MRFLQLASVAIPISIAVGVVSVVASGPIAQLEAARVARAPARDRAEPAAAVESPIAATREEVAIEEDDDGVPSAESEVDSPPQRRVVTIRGCVVEGGTQTPVMNALVSGKELTPATSTKTTENGTFVLEGEIEATSSIDVIAAAKGFVPIHRDCEFDPDTGTADTTPFTLMRGCLIRGRIVMPPGIDARDVRLAVSYVEGTDLDDSTADPWSVDSDGSFVIDAVLPGALVVVTACVEGRARGATLPLEMPQSADTVVFADVILLGRASCRILLSPCHEPIETDDTRPEADDSVQLQRLDCGAEYRNGRYAEEDGSFLFTDLPAGRYAATLNASWNDARGRYEGASLGSIELAAGEDRVVDVVRPEAPRVAGEFIAARKVELFHGCQPPSVTLALERDGVRLVQSVSSRGGRFCFPSVPPGSWQLTASVDCDPLEVQAGQTELKVREIGHGMITAAVRCCTPADAIVAKLTRGDGKQTCLSRGSSRGDDAVRAPVQIAFEGCGPGPIRLEIDALGHRPIAVTTRAPFAAETIDLGTFELETEEPLHGTVVDDAGAPLAGVFVWAVRPISLDVDSYLEPGARQTCTTTSDGVGRFELPFEARLNWFEVELPEIEVVGVSPEASEPELRLRLPPSHTIRGTIVTEDGRLAAHARVRLDRCASQPVLSRSIGWTETDTSGRFSFTTHATGKVEVTARSDGDDVALDVDPITIGTSDLDLGTLVLRH